jgi:stage IV sporulation protein FB
MIQIPGKIPISIHPAFWLMAAIIGYLNTLSFLGTLIWIGVIFISVLVHEFGHALTAYAFGQHPRIELVALGGLTYHNGNRLAVWKQFFIVFNGPLFGFILFGVAYAVSYFAQQKEGVLASILLLFQVINLFWTVVNLVPVLPLDGGQLLRIVLEGFFGVKGFRYALLASAVVSVAASLFFFLYQAFLVGALFFLFAFQSYDTWRKMRFLSEEDKSEDLKASLEAAEQQLQKGSKDQALEAFQRIHRRSVHGVIHNLAAQYIAFLEYEKRNVRKAYEVLFPIRHELASDALCLLHRLAFEEKLSFGCGAVWELLSDVAHCRDRSSKCLCSCSTAASRTQYRLASDCLRRRIGEFKRGVSRTLSRSHSEAARIYTMGQKSFLALFSQMKAKL